MFWYFYIQSIAFVLFQQKTSPPPRETILKNDDINHYDKLRGYDFRFPGIASPNGTCLLQVEKNIHQLELLKILTNPEIGLPFKMFKLADYEWLYSEGGNTMKADLRAGGLFDADLF